MKTRQEMGENPSQLFGVEGAMVSDIKAKLISENRMYNLHGKVGLGSADSRYYAT